jgi:hypothetical protein
VPSAVLFPVGVGVPLRIDWAGAPIAVLRAFQGSIFEDTWKPQPIAVEIAKPCAALLFRRVVAARAQLPMMTYCAAQSRVLGVEAGTPSIEAEIWVLAGAEVGPAFVGSLFAVIFKLIHILVDEVYQVPFVRLRFGLFVQGGEAHVLAPAADIGSLLLASRARVASSAESTVRSWWSQHSQREDKADPGYVSSDMDTVTKDYSPYGRPSKNFKTVYW